MIRRSHRKSRKGCEECKRRHIRCDEQRPGCINCATADRVCFYKESVVDKSKPRDDTAEGSLDAAVSSSSVATSGRSASSSGASPTVLNQAFDLFSHPRAPLRPPGEASSYVHITHIELFHHFNTSAFRFGGPPTSINEFEKTKVDDAVMIRAAFSAPYLLHQMLAFSARQLSVEGPKESAAYYLEESMKLQTQALGLFNSATQVASADNCVALFLFSNILGIHLLADTLAYHDSTLEAFLTRFTGYLGLHRGVMTITQGAWPFLVESEIRPLLEWADEIANAKGTGHECHSVRELVRGLEVVDLVAAKGCHQALDYLQFTFDSLGAPEEFQRKIHMAFTWPLLISGEYLELLNQRRPEALVILAYYGALLHISRELWLVGDSGANIIGLINDHLGPSWAKYMEWPNTIVGNWHSQSPSSEA